jgi:hypothetical protein
MHDILGRTPTIQSDPLPPTGLGVGEGVLLQDQTEQKFAAKMWYVYTSVVSLTDI